jgi:hypothetical protein
MLLLSWQQSARTSRSWLREQTFRSTTPECLEPAHHRTQRSARDLGDCTVGLPLLQETDRPTAATFQLTGSSLWPHEMKNSTDSN